MSKNKPELIEIAVPGFLKYRMKGVRRLDIFLSDDLLVCLLCRCGHVNHPALKRYYSAYESLESMQRRVERAVERLGEEKRCESCGERIALPAARRAFYFYYSPFVAQDFVIEMRCSKGTAFFYYYTLGEKVRLNYLDEVASAFLDGLFHPALFHFRKGYVSRNIKRDLPDAREHLTQAIACYEQFWQAYLELAKLAMEEGDLDEAGRRLAQAEQWTDHGNHLCKSARVELLMATGNLAPALNICNELVSHDPENADGFYLKGIVQGKMNDYKSAKAALRKAIALDPSHVRAANALKKMGFISILPNPLRRLWKDSD